VAVVSTYSPRACGIATFSGDLYESLSAVETVDRVDVVAIAADGEVYSSPVVATIAQQSRSDYVRAARVIGRLGADVVMIQHEFGIFGGRDGEFILSLTAELAVPFVVTLHTVLSEPTPSQAAIIDELCRRAAAVLVFTQTAGDMLTARHEIDQERLHVVPHGAPQLICDVASQTRTVPMAISGDPGLVPRDTRCRFVVSSFGLISAGKGLGTTIDAVARVAELHPEVLLVIAGRTHPEVVRREGERYRLKLQERVRELDITDHVVFDDRFLTVPELAELLAATDLYVTAYTSREQIVSGALTFAVAAGRPVVSTPYLYATDLLSSGGGRLIPFGDSEALAAAIGDLIERPAVLTRLRREARRIGAALSWPAVGRVTAAILDRAGRAGVNLEAPLVAQPIVPPLRLDHLRVMIDDVGIVQHGRGATPNLATGYCIDDAARLLQVAHQLAARTNDDRWRVVAQRAIALLWLAVEDDRPGMHNFLSFDRRWLDEPSRGDHLGRAVWALGQVTTADSASSSDLAATKLLERLCDDLRSARPDPRTAAYALLGLARSDLRSAYLDLINDLADQLVDLHRANSDERWNWFEDRFGYDNARFCQALIVAGGSVRRPELTELGLQTLQWYGDECTVARTLRLPRHGGRHRDEPHPGIGDEQPLDAAALAEAEIDALLATGDPTHGRRALAAFEWFTGRNHLGVSLYDSATGGCCDGLADGYVNLNQGAESTLAYYTARLAIEAAGLPVIARRHATASGSAHDPLPGRAVHSAPG
jgi:glycosyltransferase involved in cell wall biosynthesis